ncbi:hypothetical protein L207DRAFT_520003 [Hyaloscypha variabilis F]|uniref:Uncharacterized protein n=1 Tax=Hyaloscypha variabilis (strain UAMH 11265 / GT02V1 / F) TaxID=1149755 RepID=A0A2J6QXB4_HYAVF|nr:hypothetical protein L207DRAFT_520003 [Hyaloscypha variabilis F]
MAETPVPHTPSVEDILTVKQILATKGKLPLELIDTIIDFAEYWIKTTTCRTDGEVRVLAGREGENKLLLRSYPIGYVPTKDNPTTINMRRKDEWISRPSKPWIEPDDFPNNVTQEVIDHWSRNISPRGEFICRKIVFSIKSHDQGWGGPHGCRGTYKGSSTWFDVGLETVSAIRERATFEASGNNPMPHFSIPDPQSPDADSNSIICTTRTILPITKRRVTAHEPPQTEAEFHFDLDPGLDCLQRNKTATKDTTDHVITWSCTDDIMDPDSMDAMKLDNVGRGRASGNGEFVRNLKVGDVVTIWGKTRYGNWVNNVEEVKIEVYWAV